MVLVEALGSPRSPTVTMIISLLNFFWLFGFFPHEIFVFCGAAHRVHRIVRYCLKWFNKHFVLRWSVIILRASRQPIALHISPTLSAPRISLLHAGCFTARQWRWLKATGKVVPPLSQRNEPTPVTGIRGKSVPTVALGLDHSKWLT